MMMTINTSQRLQNAIIFRELLIQPLHKMNTVKILLFIILSCATRSLYAQEDDWQTGGGSTAGNRTIHHYDNSANQASINLWSGGYENNKIELIVGYVNKQWTSKYSIGTRYENFFGEKNKRLHGMQFGMLYTPSYDWGLGLRTGAFFEAYFSVSNYVKARGWDNFTEGDMYIPLHASYRIPFTKNWGITFYGGMGFQWAIAGRYSQVRGYSYDFWTGKRVEYGDSQAQSYGSGWPRNVNWQAEGGLNLRFNHVVLNFTYSYGLTNHRMENSFDGGNTYEIARESRQDKMTFSVGFTF